MNTRVLDKILEIEAIIKSCKVCYIGMIGLDNLPYVLPFNFGYSEGEVYFHSAQKGKKVEILQQNPAVCISFSNNYELFFRNEDVACSYGMRYKSVLAYGKVEFIDDYDMKVDILNSIMQQYTTQKFLYNSPAIKNVLVFKVKVEKFEGRVHGY